MEADVNDSGVYELVARNAEGETQSQTVELTSEQVEMSLKAQEEAAETKAKKKKKKKKKTVEKKDIIAPEISSFLRNYILKEGEKIDIKCRLEEEIEEGDVEVTWTINDKVVTSDDRFEITFDGTFAKLYVEQYVFFSILLYSYYLLLNLGQRIVNFYRSDSLIALYWCVKIN